MVSVPITRELAVSLIEDALKEISVGALLFDAVLTAEVLVNVSELLPVPALDTSAVTAVFIWSFRTWVVAKIFFDESLKFLVLCQNGRSWNLLVAYG